MAGWDGFKTQIRAVMESYPLDYDVLPRELARAYDMAMKLPPSGDLIAGNSVLAGNVVGMELMFKSVFLQQSTSPEQLDLIKLLSNGFVTYWTGATLAPTKPLALAPPTATPPSVAVLNILCTFPGTTAQIPPFVYKGEPNVDTFINNFITAADIHLRTVSGIFNVIAIYGIAPTAITGPGIVNWLGFSTNSTAAALDNQIAFDAAFLALGLGDRPDLLGNAEGNAEAIVAAYNAAAGGAGGGGFGSGSFELGPVDITSPWERIAATFIAKNEGFTERATWDVNAYRLGYGTENIIGSDGKIRKVLPTADYYKQTGEKIALAANADRTTKGAALKMLEYEVSTTFAKRVIGNKEYQIPESKWNELTAPQKAALVSYVYNVGSLRVGIASAIKNGELASAAGQIQAGPTSGGGVVYPGLIRRRAQEAELFRIDTQALAARSALQNATTSSLSNTGV